jgi:dipeptidase E
MSRNDLLLLSNPHVFGRGYLQHALSAITEFIADRKLIHFAPYGLKDQDEYTERVRTIFENFGVSVIGLHTYPDPKVAIEWAEVLFVGGGNSVRLVKAFQDNELLEPVRRRVATGELSYIGSSAGTFMSCPNLHTTNDMLIDEPTSFESLGLIPFQINPHYLDPDTSSTDMRETCEQYIDQFLEKNDVPVLALNEGSWLRRIEDDLRLGGTTGARLFERNKKPREFQEGDDLSFLLSLTQSSTKLDGFDPLIAAGRMVQAGDVLKEDAEVMINAKLEGVLRV